MIFEAGGIVRGILLQLTHSLVQFSEATSIISQTIRCTFSLYTLRGTEIQLIIVIRGIVGPKSSDLLALQEHGTLVVRVNTMLLRHVQVVRSRVCVVVVIY